MKTLTLLAVAVACTASAPERSGADRYTIAAPGKPRLMVLHEAGPGPSVVFIHGATFPSELSIGFRIAGRSWMDDLRRRGFDIWALDFAGYGGSGRDETFGNTDPEAAPYGRAGDAARQIHRAVAEIGRVTGHKRVDIIAHSWGTIAAGLFASQRPDLVDRLILFGPVAPRGTGAPTEVRGAAILVTRRDQWDSFSAGIPGAKPDLDEATFDAWEAAYLATDRDSASRSPAAVRVPSGPDADIKAARAGSYPYAMSSLRVPTLLVRGAWDPVATASDVTMMAKAMTSVPGGATVITLPRGGHRMHLERSRDLLFDAVGQYLSRGTGAGK